MNVENPQVADEKDTSQFHPQDPWNPKIETPQGGFPKYWRATSAVSRQGEGAFTSRDTLRKRERSSGRSTQTYTQPFRTEAGIGTLENSNTSLE